MSQSFMSVFSGYRLKGAYAQANDNLLPYHTGGGLRVYRDCGREHDPSGQPSQPRLYLTGISRDEAKRSPGYATYLFRHVEPSLGLSPGEQEVLLAALDGMTDISIARELAISLSSVKKKLLSAFAKAADRWPEDFPDYQYGCPVNETRGPEKRRSLLAHLRDRPEELRPWSPKS